MESEVGSFQKDVFIPPVSSDLLKVLTGFIKDELYRFGIRKGVIGLSGGIDSSVSAYLTARALGKSNLTGILLPYKTSSKDSIDHALLISKKLGIKNHIINITDAVDSFISGLKDGNKIDKLRKGNIIARMRMIALYDYSQKVGGLVIGTGNKTEILLGYTTLFGDAASAINPLGDLYKTQIWQLAETLKIPKEIIRKKPSADLWKGQSDEGELGFTYKEVDRLLYYMVDLRFRPEELMEIGFKKSFIDTVSKIIRKNQFKRLPPIIAKVSGRTIGIDYRYNRDWGS